MIIKYPCSDCASDTLYVLPEPFDHIAECSKCGHPNDTPDNYQQYLTVNLTKSITTIVILVISLGVMISVLSLLFNVVKLFF